MKILLILFICIITYAIEPHKKITIENLATSINLYKNELYISSDLGKVEVYDINTFKKIKEIEIEKIYDYFGEPFYPRIFSTHTIDGENVLITSQDSNGNSKIQIHNKNGLKKIQLNNTSFIKKAYFVDKDRILIGLLSNEIILYSISKNKILWEIQPSQAVFSDLIFDDRFAFSTTEGGVIYIIEIDSGKIIKKLEGANFDNVYMLASAKNILLSAGRDKTCGIYNIKNGEFKRLKTNFLSYAVGISSDSNLGAISDNENNDILIFETKTLDKIAILKGGDALPNTIIFIDNNTIVAGFDSRNILFWKLGGEK